MYPSPSDKIRKSSMADDQSIITIIKEEKCGCLAIFGVLTGLSIILSIATTAYILSDPLTCGDAPPPAPENGLMSWDESAPVGVNSTASYWCAPGFRLRDRSMLLAERTTFR